MPNNIYLNRVKNNIDYAIKEARNAAEADHSGLTGKIRELTASELIKPMLPSGFKIGNGKISDKFGNKSKETDLIIYDSSILPPIMYSDNEGIFPVEACFFAIEIKSKLTATNVKDAIKKSKEILDLNYDVGEEKLPDGRPVIRKPILPTLFAYDTDLTGEVKGEIERYAKYDKDWKKNPTLRQITVAGKGNFLYQLEEERWLCRPANPKHNEVIDFISTISNTLITQKHQMRKPMLGPYIKDSYENTFTID